VSKRVPLELRAEIRQIVTSLHADPTVRERLARGLVSRLVPVGPSSYDDIRRMRDACDAAGLMEIR
jgi:hypothetical protein